MNKHLDFVKVSQRMVRLTRIDPRSDSGLHKDKGLDVIAKRAPEIAELSFKLYAEAKRSILIVLQGMDTAGKDGAIRHFAGMLNPQCTPVFSFKQPSAEEAAHDFLWRCHNHCPQHGQIGIFNRSYYEDVLVVRVHELVTRNVWRSRYDQINAFERILTENGTTVLKFFLHISKEEQRDRLSERSLDPNRLWKLSPSDVKERKLWDDYQEAYEDAINRCGTKHAPWHVVPADRKWHRDYVITEVLLNTLRKLNPKFPLPMAIPKAVKPRTRRVKSKR
jgi:PPK2 family polyphosphate:nucleotide phosphotransferase